MSTPAPTSWSSPEPEQLRGVALTASNVVVAIGEVASRLGLDASSLTADQTVKITNALIDAQAVVEAEINQSLMPRSVLLEGVRAYEYASGGLLDRLTWPTLATVLEPVQVLSATARPDGLFNLSLLIGLDGRQEEPIRAFVRAHAVEALRLDPGSGLGQLAVSSVSVEGQSITYEKRSTTTGAAGALPTLSTLRHYKRRGAYQAPSRGGSPWPYMVGRR